MNPRIGDTVHYTTGINYLPECREATVIYAHNDGTLDLTRTDDPEHRLHRVREDDNWEITEDGEVFASFGRWHPSH